MALTNKQLKEILSKAGVSTENISSTVDEIMVGHNASIDALKEERDKYKADAEKLSDVQKELKEVKDAMANGEKSPYKVKYETKVEELAELQKQFDDFKADIAAKELSAKKKEAYRAILKEVGISDKRIEAVLRVSPVDEVDLDDTGAIKDADDLKKTIQSEWSEFVVTQSEQGAHTSNPPQNMGGKTMTRDEIMKIKDTSERQRAWANFLENERKK